MKSLLLSILVLSSAASAQKALPLPKLYERIAPSVVTIHSKMKDGGATGSGVILHRDGFIATAAHVVEDATSVTIEFFDGSKMPAALVTLSRTEDLALLKVDAMPARVYIAKLGKSATVRVGDDVLCIGAPLGLKQTLTTGIISAIRDDYGNEFNFLPRHVLQTDASINQGNSGGALFNRRGQVIGIASFIANTGTGGSVGLGFAVPSDVVRERLFNNALPYIGLSLRPVPNALAKILNWPVEHGLLVEKVREGSQAARAGIHGGGLVTDFGGVKLLLGGDLIIKVGKYKPNEARKIHRYLHGLHSGAVIPYTIVRHGKSRRIDVPVGVIIVPPSLP